MRLKQIVSWLTALAVACALSASALASGGLIGSVSGAKQGEGIASANQGELIASQTEAANSAAPATPGVTSAPTDAATATDAAATDAAPSTSPEPSAQAEYQLSAQEQELYARIKNEAPNQEGWQMQLVGDDTLVMLDLPEYIVWNIKPETGVMELKWYRNLFEIIPDGSANPMAVLAPDDSCAALATADGAIYLISESETKQVAQASDTVSRIVWAADSSSFAYVVGDRINVCGLDGEAFTLEGDLITPVGSELEWLNPAAVPDALSNLIGDGWKFAGMNSDCVLLDKDKASCAYLLSSGAVVNYPDTIYSASAIGKSGACPIFDSASNKFRLYSSDGTYSDIPMLDVINEGDMANPYGWLGDSVCVLEQNFTSRASFRLHAANTVTGITYTLLTPWEYAQLIGVPVTSN